MTADDYYSGSVSAAFGGNTCIVPFAAQHRGQKLADVLELYHGRAGPKSVIDYSFHLIISDPTDEVLHEELPKAISEGISSFKIYMTYADKYIDDASLLRILETNAAAGGLTYLHCENDCAVTHLIERHLAENPSAQRLPPWPS